MMRETLTRGPHAALSYCDAPHFMTRLRERRGMAAAALEFTVLTGVRTSEALHGKWSEIDVRRCIWNIPIERVKIRKTLRKLGVTHHRVPLSDAALALLERARRSSEACAESWLFPGQKPGRPLSNGAMERVLDRMKVAVTVHGFRSTVRDWAGDVRARLTDRTLPAFSYEACEITLGHLVGDAAKRAYRRSDALGERRQLLKDWAAYLDGALPAPLTFVEDEELFSWSALPTAA